MAAQKIRRNEKFRLKRSLKKNSFDRWRLVTSGFNTMTGEEKVFFIEFFIINPYHSPKVPVLGFRSNFDRLTEDFQFVLPGSTAANEFEVHTNVIPSYFLIKAGVLSPDCCQMNGYYPCADVEIENKDCVLSLKAGKYTECTLTDSAVIGSVSVTEEDLFEHPEYLCNAGSMSWNLVFDRQISFSPDYRSRDINWAVLGAKTDFKGVIIFNGEEYKVNPKTSYGFYDKNWGHDFSSPFYHLACSSLKDVITGGMLNASTFAVQGEYKNRLSVLLSIEGQNIEFHADRKRGYKVVYDCQQCTVDEEERVHWSLSVQNRQYVIDIDVYSPVKATFLRDYESPSGNRKVMRILSGASGYGRLNIYKKVKKSIVQIHQIDISKCICEYGNIELPVE